jgi:hypothetical protein
MSQAPERHGIDPNGSDPNGSDHPSNSYQEIVVLLQYISNEQRSANDQNNIQHRENINWAKRTFWIVFAYAFLTLVIAGAGIYAGRQAHIAAAAATEQAAIQEKAFASLDRPYLFISPDYQFVPRAGPQHIGFDIRGQGYTVKNFGRAPAIVNVDRWGIFVGILPKTPTYTGNDFYSVPEFPVGVGDTATVPGSNLFIERSFSIDEYMKNFNIRGWQVYFIGQLIYEDPVGIRRQFGFCYMAQRPIGRWVKAGGKPYNYDREEPKN